MRTRPDLLFPGPSLGRLSEVLLKLPCLAAEKVKQRTLSEKPGLGKTVKNRDRFI
jgi:hypothetical protein